MGRKLCSALLVFVTVTGGAPFPWDDAAQGSNVEDLRLLRGSVRFSFGIKNTTIGLKKKLTGSEKLAENELDGLVSSTLAAAKKEGTKARRCAVWPAGGVVGEAGDKEEEEGTETSGAALATGAVESKQKEDFKARERTLFADAKAHLAKAIAHANNALVEQGAGNLPASSSDPDGQEKRWTLSGAYTGAKWDDSCLADTIFKLFLKLIRNNHGSACTDNREADYATLPADGENRESFYKMAE
ncbi:hypothetical protein ERJ75_000173800 [Trypanosoma vivax]|nr:hypothetical protein ERJ75_000173800 [Trypanosoma vivax]